MVRYLRTILQISCLSSILAACAGERPDNLGVHGARLQACPDLPNCVSSQAVDVEHRIPPLEFTGDPGQAFARLKQMLARRKDTSIIEERPDYLRVEFHTILFVDDGEFLLDDQRRLIHTRSASRLGYSDLGKNRKRMEEIRRQFVGKTSSTTSAEGKF